jgi:hypothetical protein
MAILWDDGFFTELDDNRILTITGRLSSGKSLLAVELSERKLKKGYRLLSQMRCTWNDPYSSVLPDEQGKYHVFVIFDEGGLYFRSWKAASAVSTFAAKIDSYVVFAGRKLPHDDLQSLTCQVWFDFFKWFLIPLKIWRYDVVNGKKTYNGYFIQTGWWQYWGIYDTLDPGGNPETLVTWFKEATKTFFKRYGHDYDLSDMAGEGGQDTDELGNELTNAARIIQTSSQALSRSKTFGGR